MTNLDDIIVIIKYLIITLCYTYQDHFCRQDKGVEMKVRARACIRCKEYMRINPNDPLNQILIKKFEKMHIGHVLITIDVDEIKGIYTMANKTTEAAVIQ
jgi:hypothetical protein